MKQVLYSEFKDNVLVYNHIRYENLKVEHIPPQTHDVFEMIYLKNGDISYLVEEKSYRISSNTLILTRPGKLHSLQIHDRDAYDRYDIFFEDCTVLGSVLGKIPEGLDVLSFQDNMAILELFEKMDRYCKYFSGEELKTVLADLIEQILYELVIFTRQRDTEHEQQHTANPTIAAAIAYIDNHLDADICLDDLCQALYISKSYLHQLFMRHLQSSPHRYIMAKRLLAIRQRIRAGARPTDIYAQYGFSEYSSFYRAYVKQFGYAPSEEGKRSIIREIEF